MAEVEVAAEDKGKRPMRKTVIKAKPVSLEWAEEAVAKLAAKQAKEREAASAVSTSSPEAAKQAESPPEPARKKKRAVRVLREAEPSDAPALSEPVGLEGTTPKSDEREQPDCHELPKEASDEGKDSHVENDQQKAERKKRKKRVQLPEQVDQALHEEADEKLVRDLRAMEAELSGLQEELEREKARQVVQLMHIEEDVTACVKSAFSYGMIVSGVLSIFVGTAVLLW